MLQHSAVDNFTFGLIQNLQRKPYIEGFLLVGGTALALQIGHRRSIDIDLFIDRDFDANKLLELLESDFSFYLDSQETNTVKGSINGVKVDIMAHKYTLLKTPLISDGIKLASLIDIAAMKLNAISGNGTRVKDFIDLFFLLNFFSVEEMLQAYEQKYIARNSYHVLKSLNYFEDVRLDDWPDMTNKKLTWKTMKTKINKDVINYSRSLLKGRV